MPTLKALLSHPSLVHSPYRAAAARDALRACAWCWPAPADPLRLAAAAVAGEPPPPGHALPLLTAPTAAWTVPEAGGRATVERAALAEQAIVAWNTASLVLPRALPAWWSADPPAAGPPPAVLARVAYGADPTIPYQVVDGESLGLGFLLVQGARVLGVSLPPDLACSARIDDRGQLHAVDGLDEKCAVLEGWLLGVKRLLVAPGEAEKWRDVLDRLGADVEAVLEVDHGAAALELALGAAARALVDTLDRPRAVRTWFGATLPVPRAGTAWEPVAAATGHACASWQDLSALDKWHLGFAHAVSSRHLGRHAPLDMPPDEAMQPPVARRILSHLVSHHIDWSEPSFPALEALSAHHLGEPETDDDHRLHGAWGRLLARQGRIREAIDRERRCARYFASAQRFDDVSYPLSEWLRLTGCTVDDDGVAFDEANAFAEEVLPLVPEMGRPWVVWARARAAVALGRGEEGWRVDLRALVGDGRAVVATFLRCSAARWLLRGLETNVSNLGAADHQAAEALLAAVGRSDGALAAEYGALVALDRAVRDADSAAAQTAVGRLASVQPRLVASLREAGFDDAALALHYPY